MTYSVRSVGAVHNGIYCGDKLIAKASAARGSWEAMESIVTACNAHAALTARVAELESSHQAEYLMRCELERALRALVIRVDGPEGVRADGSNMDTTAVHAELGDFVQEEI